MKDAASAAFFVVEGQGGYRSKMRGQAHLSQAARQHGHTYRAPRTNENILKIA